MRRINMFLSAIVMLGTILVGGHTSVAAQDQERDHANHPLVGTWTLMTDDQTLPGQIIFSADGSVIDLESSGAVSLGAWEPTGDATANLTITVYDDADGGNRIRASFEVAPDGQTFTATYTIELFDPATGESMGEYGPGTATGERAVIEGPGTPVGSFEDLFSQFEGTPEASPVADMTDNVIQITLSEFVIEADQVTLTAGQDYTFIVTNQGLLVHELVIEPAGSTDEPLEAGDRESEIEDIAPGASPELTWTFEEPGMYQFTCHIPGHFELGMVLEFEVVAP